MAASPTKPVTATKDPDDNVFLECAEAANAHYLLTGNIKDYPDCNSAAISADLHRHFTGAAAESMG